MRLEGGLRGRCIIHRGGEPGLRRRRGTYSVWKEKKEKNKNEDPNKKLTVSSMCMGFLKVYIEPPKFVLLPLQRTDN